MHRRKTPEKDTKRAGAAPLPDFGPKHQIVDLFCGCGGLSLGFELTGRFTTVLGSDIKPEAVETFRRNHARNETMPEVITEDIRKLTASDLYAKTKRFGITDAGQLACLVGGPPCEGFSQNRSINAGGLSRNGKSSRVDKFIDDPRNHLFKWFVGAADALRPAVVLIENVPDLMRHRGGATLTEILGALSEIGYRTRARVLNAADYGVPQMRRRAFFLAQRREDYDATGLALDFPHTTHRPYPMWHQSLDERQDWLPGDSGYWPTVWEAIGDLPDAFDDDFDHAAWTYPDAPLTGLRRFVRDPQGVVPYNHIARRLGPGGLERVRALGAGQRANELPDDLRLRSHYHYSYARLNWSEPARTITKFAYHVGSGMFCHPTEDRAITMREAARLQTFPDWFRFYSDNIRELSALVGSAVPPLLASQLARQIALYLDALALARLRPEQRALARTQATDAVMRRMERDDWHSDRVQPSLSAVLHESNGASNGAAEHSLRRSAHAPRNAHEPPENSPRRAVGGWYGGRPAPHSRATRGDVRLCHDDPRCSEPVVVPQ